MQLLLDEENALLLLLREKGFASVCVGFFVVERASGVAPGCCAVAVVLSAVFGLGGGGGGFGEGDGAEAGGFDFGGGDEGEDVSLQLLLQRLRAQICYQ